MLDNKTTVQCNFYNKTSLCENYVHTTGQSDWYLLNFDLSWIISTCPIIEYRVKIEKKLPIIVTDKPKISTSLRQVLSDIDLLQTRFHIDCKTILKTWNSDFTKVYIKSYTLKIIVVKKNNQYILYTIVPSAVNFTFHMLLFRALSVHKMWNVLLLGI